MAMASYMQLRRIQRLVDRWIARYTLSLLFAVLSLLQLRPFSSIHHQFIAVVLEGFCA
jgi:hypothetical protein